MELLSPALLKCTRKVSLRRLTKLPQATEASNIQEESSKKSVSNKTKLNRYFDATYYLKDVKLSIPEKHFIITRKKLLQHLYLIDQKVAKDVSQKILPYLRCEQPHIVCETNPGLGLITTELLRNDVDMVRLYESCIEFRQILKNLSKLFPERIELFTKDIFQISTLSYADRFDSGTRVKEMLKGIPKKPWNKGPIMTIIGPMPHTNFIKYLIKMIVLQQEIISHGRVQLFAMMRDSDYEVLEANPDMKSNSYRSINVLFQMMFTRKVLSKYSRRAFLPWQNKNCSDSDLVYLIKINENEHFSVEKGYLLHLYYFIRESFRKTNQKIIPTMEHWLPGIGLDLILSRSRYKFKTLNIYTQFKELNPKQLIHVFQVMLNHPEFKSSPFVALMESQLLKDETVETDAIVENEKGAQNCEDNLVSEDK